MTFWYFSGLFSENFWWLSANLYYFVLFCIVFFRKGVNWCTNCSTPSQNTRSFFIKTVRFRSISKHSRSVPSKCLLIQKWGHFRLIIPCLDNPFPCFQSLYILKRKKIWVLLPAKEQKVQLLSPKKLKTQGICYRSVLLKTKHSEFCKDFFSSHFLL